MDFAAVICFLILYYLRPQEWPLGLGSIRFVQITMLTGLVALFFRERGLRLRDLFRTPHDWAVLAFWLWLVFASPTPWQTFKDSANLYIFYIVIVQALYTVPRLLKFVGWWTFLVAAIAMLALLSLQGIDPLSSLELTNGPMQGRLTLNLSIFDNPNALGHSLIPAIPLLYYFCIWKRPIVLRVLGTALLVAVGAAIYLTLSKGAFVAGAVTIVATLSFGRPKSVQIAIVCAAFMFGGPLLYALPRMQELNKTKGDEAIQGRVMAFKHGFKMMTTTDRGVGFRNWGPSFLAGQYRFKQTRTDQLSLRKTMPIVSKAPHSSYVQIGAELGYTGFFLFFGILYCCLRTLVTARTATPDEERVRRILFVIILSYMASSWMVDFAYRPTFIMFAAATAALHRHLSGLNQPKKTATPEPEGALLQPPVPTWRAQLRPLPMPAGALVPVAVLEPLPTAAPAGEPAPRPRTGLAFAWNRLGWVDFALTYAMTYAAVRYWSYLVARM